MSIATEIQRLRTAKEDIKTAIEEKGVEVGDGLIDTYAEKIKEITGGGNGDYEQGFEDGKNSVVDLARNAKSFQLASAEGFPEETIFNFDYIDSLMDFWSGITNTNVKHVILNVAKQLRTNGGSRAFNNPKGDDKTLEHITFNVDFSGVTSCTQVFYNFPNLKIVDGTPIDFSSATSINAAWCVGNAIEEIRVAKETIKVNIAVNLPSASNETIQSFIDGLADLTGGTTQTVTFHSTVGAKLTDEQKATITAKNWTLAY